MALRKIAVIENLETQKRAIVYRDVEWDEYRVKFHRGDKYEGEDSDYHTTDKPDAIGTASHWVNAFEGV